MSSFGDYIREKRQTRELTLREAAKKIGFSSPYLSQIENGDEPAPPVERLKKIAEVYEISIHDILAHATARAEEEYGKNVVESPVIQALFKMARALEDEDKIVEAIQDVCKKNKLDPQEFLDIMKRHKTKFPRLPRMSEGLLAAEVQPRFLSKIGLAKLAKNFLTKHGLGPDTYVPPTPIERLVEREGVTYLSDDNLQTHKGKAIELGMSHWSKAHFDRREIRINAALDTDEKGDNYRLRYTVGHELFH